jgi:tetratricopeptide (TPR) repeat protein
LNHPHILTIYEIGVTGNSRFIATEFIATQSPQAYQLYLNGLFYVRKGGFENTGKALDYFNQAVVLDPNFALAWVGAARAHSAFAGNSLLEPQEALAKAKAAVHKALELDERLAEAHAMLGRIKQNEWDWAEAEREYKRAIELNPNLAEARFRYSDYLSFMGRHTEALAEIKRVHALDPLQDSLRVREAWTLSLARRYDEAIEKLQNAVKLEPNSLGAHSALGFTYAAKGMYEQAVEEFQKVISIQGETTSMQCYLGYALAKSDKRSEAKAILDKLKTTKEYVSPTELAELYVGLGDNEGAIASLERAYAAHDLQLQTLRVFLSFDSLRSDPRFSDLLRRVGLPQ